MDYVENALYVRWSALGLGRVTYFDRFIFTLAAPITVFSWLLGCFTNRFRGDVALGSDIEHTYDYIDITSWLQVSQSQVVKSILRYLKRRNVDVADYEAASSVSYNFSINGNGNKVGAVSQGNGSRAQGRA
ncbi:MAG: hypothetical protein ACOYL5_07605 [Phototrophicaceae bacterium]